MRFSQLRTCLDRGIPVLLMLQARNDPKTDYTHTWDCGHWVVAIGYDREVVYFEDPCTKEYRAYLSYVELDDRWHDVEGPSDCEVYRYGVALPKPRGASLKPGGVKIKKASWMN